MEQKNRDISAWLFWPWAIVGLLVIGMLLRIIAIPDPLAGIIYAIFLIGSPILGLRLYKRYR